MACGKRAHARGAGVVGTGVVGRGVVGTGVVGVAVPQPAGDAQLKLYWHEGLSLTYVGLPVGGLCLHETRTANQRVLRYSRCGLHASYLVAGVADDDLAVDRRERVGAVVAVVVRDDQRVSCMPRKSPRRRGSATLASLVWGWPTGCSIAWMFYSTVVGARRAHAGQGLERRARRSGLLAGKGPVLADDRVERGDGLARVQDGVVPG